MGHSPRSWQTSQTRNIATIRMHTILLPFFTDKGCCTLDEFQNVAQLHLGNGSKVKCTTHTKVGHGIFFPTKNEGNFWKFPLKACKMKNDAQIRIKVRVKVKKMKLSPIHPGEKTTQVGQLSRYS